MSLLRVARCSYWRSGAASAVVSEQTSPFENSVDRYQPQFEGLRSLAVLTVMVDHFGADVPNFPLPDWIHLGATGVRLFLVLSGYFITASLRRARGRMESDGLSAGKVMRAFYWRRFLRISPAYGVYVVIALILGLGTIRQNWAWVFTGTVNWLIALKNEWPLAVFASLVDLRAGAILSALAAVHSAASTSMDAADNHFRCVGWRRVSNWLRDFFRANDRPLGFAFRQPRLSRGRCSPWLVWRPTPARPRRLVDRGNLFLNAHAGRDLADRRRDAVKVGNGRTARSRRFCGFSGADGDRIRWLHCPVPDSSRAGLCGPDQLRPLYISYIGCDGL